MLQTRKKFIIIGASAAGIGAVQKLRSLAPESDITLIAAQESLPYNTCHLADYLSGQKNVEQVHTRPLDYFAQHTISVLLGERVVHIDSAAHHITTTKRQLAYDALLIATGARPVQPFTIPSLRNAFMFHTLADAQQVLGYAQQHPKARVVVIGAGLSGLEVADALHKQGLNITIVERSATVMPGLVNQAGADFLQNRMLAMGIAVHVGSEVDTIIHDGTHAQGVRLKSGEVLHADCIITAVGVQPVVELARSCGIDIDAYGIVTNESMQTSSAAIYAAGDCVSTLQHLTRRRMRSCLWADAMMQGLVAAHNMVGQHKVYTGALPIISSSFFGVTFFSYLDVPADSRIHEVSGADFYHAYFMDQEQRVRGYLLIGNTAQQPRLRRALLTNSTL